ncbi:8-amino-7-oxononanoate synthase [Hydrogenophaga sp. IBVHS2]|uniref:aminotransferase class I/II-fold pyridoxal phosphate-dependent enzyme n=1 Tax=Hydrogenophaga sp. IBVHS2 TaxID=1985170 RepID=UPI000A2DF020|nr:8-amino-7-oxononanoate synthase [Hydrogenophaga sp. IBVHS2]OSZ63846.1 8-amino-7-oxononanoate synthase [Hydrogenophaga sp. IBVHS2]
MWFDHFRATREQLAAQDLLRQLRVAHGGTAPHQPVATAGGAVRELLMFCSNDYLGLAAHPALADALVDGARRWGGGSGASPLVSGHSQAHEAVAQWLARAYAPHLPQPRALGFCTGYMANLGVVTALGDADVELFCDALNHASLIDGARLARARVTVYPHGDVAALAQRLQASTAPRKLIVTDGVFSMDGDVAPLPGLLALADAFDALLLVDDAHGLGVLGQRGLGCIEHFGLNSRRLVLVGTLGKSAGLAGAFVVAHQAVTDHLLQKSRNYIFSTASPPAIEHALLTALELLAGPEGQRRRHDLQARCEQLRAGLTRLLQQHPELPWRLTGSSTPIQPLVVGANAEAMRLAARLEQAGIRVPGIRPPTVPAGTARLRITLCASHTEADVERLLRVLRDSAAEAQQTETEGAGA